MSRRSVVTAGASGIAVGCALLLTACGGGETTAPSTAAAASSVVGCNLPVGPVVIVGTARANAAAPELTPSVQAAVEVVVSAAKAGGTGYLAHYDADGDPSLKAEQSVVFDAKNDFALQKQVEELRAGVAQEVTSAVADAPEADLLAALEVAARQVHGHGDAGTVVVLDSGLQTTGALDHTRDGMVLADPDELAQALADSGQLPDLAGITVVFAGLGDTSGAQEALGPYRARLVDQWKSVASTAGASCVSVDDTPFDTAPPPGLPGVTAVDVPQPPALALPAPGGELRLGEEVIGFKPDLAEFRDPDAARDALRPIAEELVSSGLRVELVGTTATALTEEQRRALSQSRAEAVRDELVNMGVPAANVAATGVGTDHPAHVQDTDADGSLIPDMAARNRAVFVTVLG